MRTDFFGMTGHQLVGATYNTKNFSSIDQSLRIILEDRTIEAKDNTWCFYYNFDQYLYEPKKGSGNGLGLFGRFGASDGNPNLTHYFYSIGFGGKGVIPGRPNDGFGIGYYYMDISQPRFTGPLETRTALRGEEQGFEAYYNFALTPWMVLTPDIQVIRGAQKDTATITGRNIIGGIVVPTVTGKSVDTATVLGFRLQLVF